MARGDTQPCGYGAESEFGSHLQHLRPSRSLFCLPPLLSSLLPLRLCPSSWLSWALSSVYKEKKVPPEGG